MNLSRSSEGVRRQVAPPETCKICSGTDLAMFQSGQTTSRGDSGVVSLVRRMGPRALKNYFSTTFFGLFWTKITYLYWDQLLSFYLKVIILRWYILYRFKAFWIRTRELLLLAWMAQNPVTFCIVLEHFGSERESYFSLNGWLRIP